MDWWNEIANSLVLHATGRAALWTAPGKTAFLVLIGLNVEIVFLFSIAGIAMSKMLPADPRLRVLGVPNRLFIAVAGSIFCVAVEVLLNRAGMLIWAWRYWDVPHVWSIVIGGYLHFHLVSFWVYDMASVRAKALTVAVIWGVAAAGMLVFGVWFRWI